MFEEKRKLVKLPAWNKVKNRHDDTRGNNRSIKKENLNSLGSGSGE